MDLDDVSIDEFVLVVHVLFDIPFLYFVLDPQIDALDRDLLLDLFALFVVVELLLLEQLDRDNYC